MVAAEVRASMARRNIKPARVAVLLGLSRPQWLYRRLNGEVAFDVDDLQRLAGLLNVPVTSFFPPPAEGNIARYFQAIADDVDTAGRAA